MEFGKSICGFKIMSAKEWQALEDCMAFKDRQIADLSEINAMPEKEVDGWRNLGSSIGSAMQRHREALQG